MSRRRKRLPECRADKVYWCFLTTSVLLPLPQCAGKPAPWGRGSPRDGDAAGPWQGKVLLESTREDKYCLSAPSTGRQSGARQGGGVLGGKGTSLFLEPGTEPSFSCSWKRSPSSAQEKAQTPPWGLLLQLVSQPGGEHGSSVLGEDRGHPNGSL